MTQDVEEEEEEFTGEVDEEEEDDALEVEGGDDSGEASLDEILAKKPDERAGSEEDEDEESMLAMGREDRIETLSVKVEPKRENEFVCKKCYLVKPIRSQLADKRRMLCRDCA